MKFLIIFFLFFSIFSFAEDINIQIWNDLSEPVHVAIWAMNYQREGFGKGWTAISAGCHEKIVIQDDYQCIFIVLATASGKILSGPDCDRRINGWVGQDGFYYVPIGTQNDGSLRNFKTEWVKLQVSPRTIIAKIKDYNKSAFSFAMNIREFKDNGSNQTHDPWLHIYYENGIVVKGGIIRK